MADVQPPRPGTAGDDPIRVGLVLFEQVDLLDVGGPYEVLLTANRLAARAGAPPPFEVVTVAVGNAPVTAYGGLGLVPSHHLADGDPLDVVLVPGTIDVDTVLADPHTMGAIAGLAASTPLVTTVCTGAVILAGTGHLDDAPAATTHHEDVAMLSEVIGDRAVTARWVDAGDVVTAGGLSSGIAMALHLVQRLVARDLAVATARQIEYDWDPDDGITTG